MRFRSDSGGGKGVAFLLSVIDWGYFGSLTFASVPPRHRRFSLAWQFLRESAAPAVAVSFPNLAIALRHEVGELGDRPHFHFLIGGRRRDLTCCYRMERAWNVLTGARQRDVRVYDSGLAGPDYVAKCLGTRNAYELNKYDKADEVTLSDSAVWQMRRLRQYCGEPEPRLKERIVSGEETRVIPPVPRGPDNMASLPVPSDRVQRWEDVGNTGVYKPVGVSTPRIRSIAA